MFIIHSQNTSKQTSCYSYLALESSLASLALFFSNGSLVSQQTGGDQQKLGAHKTDYKTKQKHYPITKTI
jgi:hypothetical protein